MTLEAFWKILDEARCAVERTTDIPDWLVRYLKDRPLEDIVGFAECYHALCNRAYDALLWDAAEVMLGMCSDDKFTDFHGWLIAKGKEVYENALKSPDSLSTVDGSDGDNGKASLFYMGSAASKAYCERIGDELADLPIDFSSPVLSNEDAWDTDSAQRLARLPNLCAKYRKPKTKDAHNTA